MDFEGFGFKYHMEPCYLLASNNFIGIPHFNDEGEELDNEQIHRFTNFILSLDSDDISLSSYLEEGGDLMDAYEYYQYGNGDYNIITIPEMIISCGSVKLVREMISIDPDYVNIIVDNYSVLAHSIMYGHNEITDLLLLHGANPNIQGKRGKTSLYHAINRKVPSIVKKLLDNGADPNMKYALPQCNYLYTALINYTWSTLCDKEIILNSKKIVKMIIKCGGECQDNLYNDKIRQSYNDIMSEMAESGEY